MKRYPVYCTLVLIFCLLFWNCVPESYDLVIIGGIIIDGTGAPGYIADIGIRAGRIVKIGRLKSGQGSKVVAAAEKVIIPGFIDMHTHCDNLRHAELKAGLNYLTQGVTTVVSGSCGSGAFKVKEFFAALEANGIGVNVVHMVGQGRVRGEVIKNADRKPTAAELEKMTRLIKQAMSEGAAGMSSGLFYAPGSFANTEEIISLLEPVKKYKGIYHTHLRDESDYGIGLLAAVTEAITIGEKAGIPVQISHIKALGKPVWGSAPEVALLIENAQQRGLKIYADQYPYNASSTGLIAAVIPRWVQGDSKLKERLQDPDLLSRIKTEIAANIERRGGAETLVISSFAQHPEWVGKNLLDIASIMKKSPVDTAVELALMGGPSLVSFNMTDEDVEFFMRQPWVMTGSDGLAQVPGQNKPHPRSYGTFPRKLRTYVLEKNLLSMEQAVRAATSLPAQMLGLSERGQLKPGFIADITIFDPKRIRDLATYIEPHQYSEGIDFVLIQGKIIIADEKFTGTLAGQPLRHKYQQ